MLCCSSAAADGAAAAAAASELVHSAADMDGGGRASAALHAILHPEMTPRAEVALPAVSVVVAAARAVESIPSEASSAATDSDSECDELIARLQLDPTLGPLTGMAQLHAPRAATSAAPFTTAAPATVAPAAADAHELAARRSRPKPKQPARASASAEFSGGSSGRGPRPAPAWATNTGGAAHFHISVPKRPASVLGHAEARPARGHDDAKPARGHDDAKPVAKPALSPSKLPAEIPADLCAVEDYRRVLESTHPRMPDRSPMHACARARAYLSIDAHAGCEGMVVRRAARGDPDR
jgi:hypothetical protein